jgi:hypothetical protein
MGDGGSWGPRSFNFSHTVAIFVIASGKLEKNLTGLTGLFWLIFEISPLRNEISLAQAILRIKIRHLSHISGI